MTKLTKSAFKTAQQAAEAPAEPDDSEKKALVSRVYKWQQSENTYAWDADSLSEDLELGVNGFTLGGVNAKNQLVEVEFRTPHEDPTEDQGVAYGYRLTRLQGNYYNLQVYKKPKDPEPESEPEPEEVAE